MRKKTFLWLTLLCLIVIALGTRFGDVVLYTVDWWFAAAVAILFAAFSIWWLPDHPPVALSLDWSSLGLVAVLVILTCISSYRYGAQVEAAKIGAALLLAFMVLNLIQERSDLQFYMNGILFLGVGLAAISFAYYMAAMSPLFYFTPLWARNLQYNFVVNGQLWGLWQYQNSFGAFLALCTLLGFGMAAGDRRRDLRLLYSTCAGFLLMVLYLTTSRGAFLTGAVGLIVLILLAPREQRGRLILRVLCIGAAAAGLTFLNRVTWATTQINASKGQQMQNFVSGTNDQSLGTRVHLALLSLRLFRAHPWIGTGLGTFPLQWTVTEWVPDVARRIDPHSFFFRFLAETGLLGTVPLFAWIARRGLRGLNRIAGSRDDITFTGLWAGTLAYFLHMCIDVDYVYAVAPAVLFFCLALLAAKRIRYDILLQDDRRLIMQQRRWACLAVAGVSLLLAMAPLQRGVASLYGLALGDLDQTARIERLTDATARDPGNDTYWDLLGSARVRSLAGGMSGPVTDAARTAFRQASILSPADYRPMWNLGMLEMNLKAPDAVTYLEQTERLYPTLADIKGWLALSYIYVAGDASKAEAKAAEALAITKDDPYAIVAQGFCALARGDNARAKALFVSVAKQGFSNKFVYFGLSRYYRAVGKTDMERTELQYSQRINPNLVEAETRLHALSH